MNPDGLGTSLPTLHADGLILRSLTGGDTDAMLDLFGDPAVVRFTSIRQLHTQADASVFIAGIERDFHAGVLYQWAIERDSLVVGTCTLAGIDCQHGRAEVGFAVAACFWGQRVISRALPALVTFAFDRLGLRRLEADADPRNEASLRALERQGFQREGYLRGRYLQLGEVQDAVVLGLLRQDWQAHRRSVC